MGKISIVVITKNEEKMIGDCLKSTEWVDHGTERSRTGEVLVIDTGNTDKTNEIARKLNARVVTYKGKGSFADWRNFGAKQASGDFILYIDADERVTPALRIEIEKVINETVNKYSAYAIPRRNFIFGKEFKHSGQYPDYQKRFFKKSILRKWHGDVHEEPEFDGELGYLKNPLIHLKKMTLHEMVEKTNIWSEIEAKLMFDAKHPPMNILRFGSAMAREAWKRMFLELAFLDGYEGIIYAVYQVFSKFTSYAKLYEMQLKNK